MDYKKALTDLLEQMSTDGLEGMIPNVIAESLSEAKLNYNSNESILYWASYHCNCARELKLNK